MIPRQQYRFRSAGSTHGSLRLQFVKLQHRGGVGTQHIFHAHEQLLGPLVEASRALRVGDGLEDASDVGPVISCAARDRIRDWISRGEADGAKV